MGIAQIFGTAVSFYLVCPSALAAQKTGQNITVLPSWGEKTYFVGCCFVIIDLYSQFFLITNQSRSNRKWSKIDNKITAKS